MKGPAATTERKTSRVPCLDESCGADVDVALPMSAFAVWTEEF